MPVSRETAAWGIRLLLGSETEDASILDFHRAAYDTTEAMRDRFMQTPEARTLFENANNGATIRSYHRERYLLPSFLLRRPSHNNVEWCFSEPSLEKPVSQLCTYEQMTTPTYRALCARLGLDGTMPHRKIWEFAFIVAALEEKGMLAPGRRGLGFGTGQEPLPSVFAKAGVEIVATDAPAEIDGNGGWAETNQWSQGLEELWHPALVERDDFFSRVHFRAADMNHIPAELRDFDFCWSACAFEHLGSLRLGLDYLHASLATLKPGGVSVQTTEFNLSSNDETLDRPGLSVFRKQDFETVIHELVNEGHTVAPLNLWPGATTVDEHIDVPPYSSPHLKLELEGVQTTSIGLIITKRLD